MTLTTQAHALLLFCSYLLACCGLLPLLLHYVQAARAKKAQPPASSPFSVAIYSPFAADPLLPGPIHAQASTTSAFVRSPAPPCPSLKQMTKLTWHHSFETSNQQYQEEDQLPSYYNETYIRDPDTDANFPVRYLDQFFFCDDSRRPVPLESLSTIL